MSAHIYTQAQRWALPAITALLWLWVGWSAVAWGLQAWGTAQVSASKVAVASQTPLAQPEAGTEAVARMLGGSPGPVVAAAAPALLSRLLLVGVASAGASQGAALMGVDGAPPKAFRVGQTVVDALVLQSVDKTKVRLGADMAGPTLLQLDMPLLKQP